MAFPGWQLIAPGGGGGGGYDVCVLLYDGGSRMLTESSFMEKPGLEPSICDKYPYHVEWPLFCYFY